MSPVLFNFQDFLIFRTNYNTIYPDSDFNGSGGTVNFQDFLIFRALYNVAVGPSYLNTTFGTEQLTYLHDLNGNVDNISTTARSEVYAYDTLDRLNNQTVTADPIRVYGYDRNGNRETATTGVVVDTYGYTTNSNLLSIDPDGPITYDAAGNLKSDRNGLRTFNYNSAGRLFEVYEGPTLVATYSYNALGQRTRKVTIAGTTVYHYDQNSTLVSETNELGNAKRDYITLNSIPVAQIDIAVGDTITYLHTDHLGTPRRGTDTNVQVIWSWQGEAFGATLPNEDPDGDLQRTVVDLRFPGQYYDEETGLHYNYFRYYDPAIGRYITSDPIGLRGGLNTYAYVANNPLVYSDPFGLAKICYRPLDSWATPIVIGRKGSLADRDNNIVGHEHIMFDDGSNIGFGPGGTFNETGREAEYSQCTGGFDDKKLKEAVKNTPTGKYNFFFKNNNCQDWIERVRIDYGKR